MPDVLGDGRYGRDDGIICDKCKGPTYLVYDDGGGLMSYQCDNCDESFGVQYDSYDDDDSGDDNYYEPPFDISELISDNEEDTGENP